MVFLLITKWALNIKALNSIKIMLFIKNCRKKLNLFKKLKDNK